MSKIIFHLVVIAGIFVLPCAAPAVITISGGSGAPLSVSFTSPPGFTMTSAIDHDTNGMQLYLVISDIMSAAENTFSAIPTLDNVQWANDGAGGGNSSDNFTQAVVTYDFAVNDIAPSDLWVWLDTSGQTQINDVITFSSVEFTTGDNFSSTVPDGISVDVFLTNESGVLASNVVSETTNVIPEPAGALLLLLGAVGVVMRTRR